MAPSTAIATKTPGYERRITANTGSCASMAPLARSTRSLDIDSHSSASIITSTAASTMRGTISVSAGPKGPALQCPPLRQRHVARALDQIFDWRWPPRRDERGQSDGAGRPDHHAKRSVDTPLHLELAAALSRKLVVCRLARREFVEGGARRELAAAKREPKPVAGHGIDEACRVTGQQQT